MEKIPFCIIDEAMTFINRHIPVSSRFVENKAERIDIPLFPPLAIREAVINAVAHKDYSVHGSAVSIAIYDDRIEIESTGMLPNGTTIESLWNVHRSNPRNELISHVLYLRGIIEQWGRGTNEIIRFCKDGGYRNPEFIERQGCFVVSLWAKKEISSIKPTHIREEISLKYRLNKEQQEILKILAKFGGLSSSEILAKMTKPIPDRTLRSYLSSLKNKNLIDKKGKGRSTVWLILQEK